MIEGAEPDPRDDIYALACTFYELLTGRHPFNKQSAVQARDAKMVPAPVPGLSRSQWRGLLRGLAFKREQRSPTVMQFLNDVSPQRRSPVRWIAIAAGVVIVVAGVALFLPGYLEKRRLQAIAEVLENGDDQTVPDALERMAKLTPEQRSTLLAPESPARDGLLTYFEKQIAAATDESKQKYEYARAMALLAQAQAIFSDSSRVATMKQTLEARQSDLINRLSRRFDDTLTRGWLIDKQNPENASRVLSILAQVQPQHPLLTDKRLLIAYSEQAGAALDRANGELAGELIAAGLKLSPQDEGLKDLSDRVRQVVASQQSVQRVRTLRASIDTALGSSPALEAFDTKRTELAELRAVAPDDAALARWQSQMQTQLDRRLVEMSNKRSFTDAEALLGRYAELASTAYVADRRDALTSARKEFTENLARLGDALQAAIRAGRLGPPAADNAKSIYASLERAGADTEQLAAAKDQISTAYARQAGELRSKGAFADARRQVTAGLDFGPSTAVKGVLQEENKEIDDAEKLARSAADQQLRARLAAQRAKEDNDFKAQLATALRAPKQSIDSARGALQLAEKLQNRGVKDPLVVNARRDIQNQLVAEIRAMSEKSGPDAAIRFAEQASALMPESAMLTAQLGRAAQGGCRAAGADARGRDHRDQGGHRHARQGAEARRQVVARRQRPVAPPGRLSAGHRSLRRRREADLVQHLHRGGAQESRCQVAERSGTHDRTRRAVDADASGTRERTQAARGCARVAGQDGAAEQARGGYRRAQAAPARPGQGGRHRIPRHAQEPETDAAGKRRVPGLRSAVRDRGVVSAPGDQGCAPRLLRRGGDADRSRTGKRRGPALPARRACALLGAEGSQRADQHGIESLGEGPARGPRCGIEGDPALSADVQKRFKAALETRIRNERGRNPTLASNYENIGQQVSIIDTPRAAATRPAATAAATPAAGQQSAATAAGQSAASQATQTPQPAATDSPGGVAVTPASMSTPVASKPCRAELAGKGARSAAVCFDGFASGRGPDLVVIPAGGPFTSPVSVMRYELTNGTTTSIAPARGAARRSARLRASRS